MDTKEYIASGILESYVMGIASEQEQREVHCLSSIYPEIKEELNKIQVSLEEYVESIAVTPPSSVKASIMEAITNVPQEQVKKEEKAIKETKEVKVYQMPNYAKLGLVASFAVVIGLSAMYVLQNQKNNNLQAELTELNLQSEQKQSEYLNKLAELKTNLNESEDKQAFILSPSTEEVYLAGTAVKPDAKVRVYWNKDEQSLIVKNDALPKAGEGKQYQLWALADGQPIDLGVLDKDFALTAKRKIDLSEFQSFAITLEKEGGSPTPTIEQLFVIGNVKG